MEPLAFTASFMSSAIAVLWISTFGLEMLAEALNLRSAQGELPEALRSIQPANERVRAFQYLRENTHAGWLRESLMLAGFLALLFCPLGDSTGFSALYVLADKLAPQPFYGGLVFAWEMSLLQALITLPFAIHSTFGTEARYGFNRTTAKTFITDRLKGLLLGGVLSLALYSFAVKILIAWGPHAWLWVWGGYVAFVLFFTWIAPVTILPLFLKLTPLPDGDLKRSIETYAKSQSFKLDGAWVCDASKRSSKSNAFFTGFGKFRRLVLFDTLIEKHSTAEIVAIVAHEAGHFKLGHIIRGTFLAVASSFVVLGLAHLLIDSPLLYLGFGVFPPEPGIGLVLSLTVLSRAGFFFSFVTSAISRTHEYQADRFSVETARDPESLVAALTRLTLDNLANLTPHPLYVALNASHPPLIERIRAIRALSKTGRAPA